MIQSMTGYGKSTGEVNQKRISVEIRSLNSKQSDISVRMPSFYKEKELTLRSQIGKELQRGKIDFNLHVELPEDQSNFHINRSLFERYYQDLKALDKELNDGASHDLMAIVSKMPDVMKAEKKELEESEWQGIVPIIDEALTKLQEFRMAEGKSLYEELSTRIHNIDQLLGDVRPLEKERLNTVKERIERHLEEVVGKDKVNQDRWEQELIYYIEKYDVTEEITRLTTHLAYFMETMNLSNSQGKKLGFIAQEIGREINTLGSKANHAGLQKIVVQMKDELEKIKEQLLNIL